MVRGILLSCPPNGSGEEVFPIGGLDWSVIGKWGTAGLRRSTFHPRDCGRNWMYEQLKRIPNVAARSEDAMRLKAACGMLTWRGEVTIAGSFEFQQTHCPSFVCLRFAPSVLGAALASIQIVGQRRTVSGPRDYERRTHARGRGSRVALFSRLVHCSGALQALP